MHSSCLRVIGCILCFVFHPAGSKLHPKSRSQIGRGTLKPTSLLPFWEKGLVDVEFGPSSRLITIAYLDKPQVNDTTASRGIDDVPSDIQSDNR